jgi:hypothetical protein
MTPEERAAAKRALTDKTALHGRLGELFHIALEIAEAREEAREVGESVEPSRFAVVSEAVAGAKRRGIVDVEVLLVLLIDAMVELLAESNANILRILDDASSSADASPQDI